jgi:hypothetical protein
MPPHVHRSVAPPGNAVWIQVEADTRRVVGAVYAAVGEMSAAREELRQDKALYADCGAAGNPPTWRPSSAGWARARPVPDATVPDSRC